MMSRFIKKSLREMETYTPGEQPQEKGYLKLNTNEFAYPPSPQVIKALDRAAKEKLSLYPDPEAKLLKQAIAERNNLDTRQVFVGNGSDEILAFCFTAFFEKRDKVYYPDITYGFYSVFANLMEINRFTIPLKEDFTIDIEGYYNRDGNIIIANPNAPTGICLTTEEIIKILGSNPNRLVIIDEAYVDFGAQSCIPLIEKYDNLLVVQTFSKSRAMAGMRLAFAAGSADIIAALERVKFSFNPYNVNTLSMIAGIAAMEDTQYFQATCRQVADTRKTVIKMLRKFGFDCTDSKANFVFAKHETISGQELYEKLKAQRILVRHFDKERIRDYVRISIGREEDMVSFIKTIGKLVY